MKTLLIAFIIIFSSVNLFAANNTIFESVVKVRAQGEFLNDVSWGTGNCINQDNEYFYFTTNKHVVGNTKYPDLFFYRDGYQSNPIQSEQIWSAFIRNQPVDIALLRVKKSLLSGWSPTIISFDFNDKLAKLGDTCITIGCPQAEWPRAYKGHIVNVGDGVYRFTPTVIPGQSGSLLMNGDGTKAIGLIAWYEGNYGKAMNLNVIKSAVLGQNTGYYYDQPYNIEENFASFPVGLFGRGDSCGPFGCERPRIFGGGGGRRPLRPNQQQPPTLQNPWNNGPQSPLTPDKQPDGGIKIFPTYPGNPDDEFVPPVDPQNPTEPTVPTVPPQDNTKLFDDLGKRLEALEEDSKKNKLDHTSFNSRISAVETKADQILNSVNQLNMKVTETNQSVTALSTSVDKRFKDLEGKIIQPDDTKVVTPGKLGEYLKDDPTIQSIFESQQTLQEKTTESVKSIQDIFNTNINGLNKSVDNKIEDLSGKVDNSIGQQVSISNEILKALTTKQEAPPNIYYDIGQTAIGAGIPSTAILILGFFLRKVLKDFIEKLSGRVGGAVSQDPFFKNQTSPIIPQ